MGRVVHPKGDKFEKFILQVKRNEQWRDLSDATSLEGILMQEDKLHGYKENVSSKVTTRILSEYTSGKRYYVNRDYTIPRDNDQTE